MFAVSAQEYVWRNKSALAIVNNPSGYTLASSAINPAERTFVAVIEGQSLAGAHVQGVYAPTNASKIHMLNVLGGKQIYEYKEPMMGTSYFAAGHLSWPTVYETIWGKLADLLIDGDVFDRVIYCNVSYGGTSAADLAPTGLHGHRITLALRSLRLAGIPIARVDAVLTMQGEADGATQKADYKTRRLATVQSAVDFGFIGDWFIPTETYVTGSVFSAIQDGQAEMVGTNSIVAGPNFDTMGSSYRWDDVHLNETGRTEAAQRWFDVLAAIY